MEKKSLCDLALDFTSRLVRCYRRQTVNGVPRENIPVVKHHLMLEWKAIASNEVDKPSNLSESSKAASSAMTRIRSRILPATFLSPLASALARTMSSLRKNCGENGGERTGQPMSAFRTSQALIEGG